MRHLEGDQGVEIIQRTLIKDKRKLQTFYLGWKGEFVVRTYVSQTKDHYQNQITHQQ